jgi:hypothetical protein
VHDEESADADVAVEREDLLGPRGERRAASGRGLNGRGLGHFSFAPSSGDDDDAAGAADA